MSASTSTSATPSLENPIFSEHRAWATLHVAQPWMEDLEQLGEVGAGGLGQEDQRPVSFPAELDNQSLRKAGTGMQEVWEPGVKEVLFAASMNTLVPSRWRKIKPPRKFPFFPYIIELQHLWAQVNSYSRRNTLPWSYIPGFMLPLCHLGFSTGKLFHWYMCVLNKIGLSRRLRSPLFKVDFLSFMTSVKNGPNV